MFSSVVMEQPMQSCFELGKMATETQKSFLTVYDNETLLLCMSGKDLKDCEMDVRTLRMIRGVDDCLAAIVHGLMATDH
jgi:hypothetical protein